jgi:uncharacterized membrane protein YGL010W
MARSGALHYDGPMSRDPEAAMPSYSRSAQELLVQYARYHRDPRNIATHFVGIPLIVFAVGALLARPHWGSGLGLGLSPAGLLWGLTTLWYLSRGGLALGLAVSLLNLGLLALAAALVQAPGLGLGWGFGLLALGWVFQFVGHYYEGRKPAFVDDIRGLLVGPMFVTAEALFALGWGRALHQEIERGAGPTRLRDLAMPALPQPSQKST